MPLGRVNAGANGHMEREAKEVMEEQAKKVLYTTIVANPGI